MKQITNETHCPACNEEWDFCECDELYSIQDLIEKDDHEIESGFNVY